MDAVQDSIQLFKAIGVHPMQPAWMTEKSSFIKDWLLHDATLSTVELITAIWALHLGYIFNFLDSDKDRCNKEKFCAMKVDGSFQVAVSWKATCDPKDGDNFFGAAAIDGIESMDP